MGKIYFTCSWDDGHPLDFKIAELLNKYNLKGSFYIPIRNDENNVMSSKQIYNLSSDFEIGGHTYNHIRLDSVDIKTARREIQEGKNAIENILGQRLKVFAYPKGKYNNNIRNIVEESGFEGARTVNMFYYGKSKDRFQLNTTFVIGNLSAVTLFKHMIKRYNLPGIYEFGPLLLKSYTSHDKYFSILEKIYNKHRAIIHLWGHSWEIEKYNLWDWLENIFIYISQKNDIEFCNNSELLKIIGNNDFV